MDSTTKVENTPQAGMSFDSESRPAEAVNILLFGETGRRSPIDVQPTPQGVSPFMRSAKTQRSPMRSRPEELITNQINRTEKQTEKEIHLDRDRQTANEVIIDDEEQQNAKKKRKRSRKHSPNEKLKETHETQLVEQNYTLKLKHTKLETLSPFQMQREIFQCVGEAVEIKKIAQDTLNIKLKNLNQLYKLQQLATICKEEAEVKPNDRLNKSIGIIRSNDLLACSNEELLTELKDQGVSEVMRILKKEGSELKPTASIRITFNSSQLPKVIYAAYLRIEVKQCIPLPIRCLNCLKFGHPQKYCTAKQMCDCGKERHEAGTNCDTPPKCINCNEPHRTRSSECDAWRTEKEIIKYKTIHKTSYWQARQTVTSKSYVRQSTSYAGAVIRKTTPLPPSREQVRHNDLLHKETKKPYELSRITKADRSESMSSIISIESPSVSLGQQGPPIKHWNDNSCGQETEDTDSADTEASQSQPKKPKNPRGWPRGKPRINQRKDPEVTTYVKRKKKDT
ncbi:uncharacterized protein LOC116174670 [Photinus pyralis]|uniref:uncharacterized protein LOC116174670 n=1 Tax=Photinus pyralis TaxID=7054 RepID=UPI00126753F6|nr:uncharacterized protein LOC116174670 [Photinus pyralis]